MSWTEIITQMGGGLGSVVIAALGFTVFHLWKRVMEVQDKRIEDMKEHAAQMSEVISATGEVVKAVEVRRHV